MKFIDEFRDPDLARGLAATIAAEAQPARTYHLMEFCGGHTHALFRYGLGELLPANVHMIHGPGCPVCVLPIGRLDVAIRLANEADVTLCTYADMMRVPASVTQSLATARAAGADVRMVYSPVEVLEIAKALPERRVVFFAIGFETTTPPTAVLLQTARRQRIENLWVFCNHVLTPAAVRGILDTSGSDAPSIQGLIGPAHVSTVIGSNAFEAFPREYGQPVVIAGFEPLDMLQAILMLVRQINRGQAQVENQYRRAVEPEGNLRAQRLIDETMETREAFEWRGLGTIPRSARRIRGEYGDLDAENAFDCGTTTGSDNPGCECGQVLRGTKTPKQCPLFAKTCTPDNPLGACMVSSEGACAAFYQYARNG